VPLGEAIFAGEKKSRPTLISLAAEFSFAERNITSRLLNARSQIGTYT
jgi:hypothetical protein